MVHEPGMLFSLSLKVAAKLILLHNAALVEPIVYLHGNYRSALVHRRSLHEHCTLSIP